MHSLIVDMSFTIVLPLAVVVYSKKQRSSLVICYLYVELMMALYAIYVRWRNHTESKANKVDTRTLFYENTDSLRYFSVGMTIVTQAYLIQRFDK